MSYTLTTLWHDRQRYLPGILAVGFSALLINLQCGLLKGLFSLTSIPVDRTRADIWVTAPDVLSVDLGRPIPESFTLAKVARQPEVQRTEIYMQGYAFWSKPKGRGSELCMVIGSHLGDDFMGTVDLLTPEKRAKLGERGAVIIDESDKERLGIKNIGDVAEISGNRARVVDTVAGLKSLAGPYIFCSLNTAHDFLRLRGLEMTTYVLARCNRPEDAPVVVERFRREAKEAEDRGVAPKMSAFTKDEFSLRTQMHWLTKTKAGIALGYAAALGLLVGAVVTSQTLYAATAASLREFAVLRALGIPRWRMSWSVLTQSFWIGLIGICLALPVSFGLANLADYLGAKVALPWWLLLGTVVVTMLMAMLSGLAALRSLRQVEPAVLLR
jgi:putative ABC transport system permease protein